MDHLINEQKRSKNEKRGNVAGKETKEKEQEKRGKERERKKEKEKDGQIKSEVVE